jgi:hypothetical protein
LRYALNEGAQLSDSLKMPKDYRALAAELRAMIPQFKRIENRDELAAIAERYERMAERLEHRSHAQH